MNTHEVAQGVGRINLLRSGGAQKISDYVFRKLNGAVVSGVFAVVASVSLVSSEAQADATLTQYAMTTGSEYRKLPGGESAQLVYSVARYQALYFAGRSTNELNSNMSKGLTKSENISDLAFAGCIAEILNDQAGKFRDLWVWVSFSAKKSDNANRQMYFVVFDGLKNKCGG